MKKKIVTVIFILLLILVGVIFYLFKFTDFFKSDKQLFWEYASKNSEVAEIFNNESIESVKKKKVNNPYRQKSELRILKDGNLYKVTADTNAQNINDIFTTVKLESNSEEMTNFNIVKKSNLVGLKMDELANGYITVKNNNLKSLAEKIGIENTDSIPDNINLSTYLDILEISDEDVDYITNKYTNLALEKTEKNNYKKTKDEKIKINDKFHTVQAYSLSLTENEFKEIVKAILIELSNDSRALNILSAKLKLLNFPSEYTSINGLSEKFLELSKSVDSVESDDSQFVEITVYAENSKLLQTDFKFNDKNLIKIHYDKENNSLNIKQELLNKSNKFILSISDVVNRAISQIEEITIKTDVSEEHSEIITNVHITCAEDLDITYSSSTKITDDIQVSTNYEDSLKVVLNDLTEAQLKYLYGILSENVKEVYDKIVTQIKNNSQLSQYSNSENEYDEQATNNLGE